MAKAKTPKLKLSFLNSFQICRSKNPSSMIKGPFPSAATKIFSPLNSKSFDISFPSFPNPPPPTPSSKVSPFGFCGCSSSSCTMQELNHKSRNKEKMTSHDCDEIDWPIPPPSRIDKDKNEKGKRMIKKSRTRGIKGISLADGNERESLLSSSPSLNKSVGARRFRRYGSKEWKEGVESCDKKTDQSFVVVKRSVDPYEDFKKSMHEMIVEKQMFEPEELEQLLMRFLSLNSRLHHRVIIEAFTEILKEVFCG